MDNNFSFFVLTLAVLWLGAAAASADAVTPRVLVPTDLKNHAKFIKRLSSSQTNAISSIYPNFRILKLCSGHFSGSDRDELVLGIWKLMASKDRWKREVHRIGLIWNGKNWAVHNIDDEIEKDERISHSFPMHWQFAFSESGFSGEMKCGIASEFSGGSDLTYSPGDQPFFDLREKGLLNNKPVCFATSDVYNNWDCLVYSPKDDRFRLWFQQAHAD